MTDRRGNGLLADSYVPLALLPPVLADTMLEALGRAGIAAYAVTVGAAAPPPGDDTDDEAPTDHLYVDAKERAAAEAVLRAELPELADRLVSPDPAPARPEPENPDEVWADLVARFYDSDTPERDWPDAENLSEAPEDDEPDEPDGSDGPVLTSRPVRSPAEEPHDVGEEDGERYVPPPPPPLPRGDLVGRLAWGGLLGGPALLLATTLLGLPVPGWLVLVALCAFVTGFVVLLIRMGDRPSGPDDGAVV